MQRLKIRTAVKDDLRSLLDLYTYLHGNPLPEVNTHIEGIWQKIVGDINHHIILGFVEDELVASCVIVIIHNLTRGQRPYAVIENVITHPDHRQKGYATIMLTAAKEIAARNNCYKIMLMTGSKRESTLDLYRRSGFNSDDKIAFVQWV